MFRKNILRYLFFGCIYVKGLICLQLQTYTACYGSTGLSNFLIPTCNSGEQMAVVGLEALAKLQSTSCPIEITPFNSATTPDSCCQYDSIDCRVVYSVSAYRNFYRNCNGQQTCTVQATWVETPCNQTVYLQQTNYMKMDFYCIADEGLDPCTSLSTKDSQVFLWNSGYPSTSLSGSSYCTCSVEASCDAFIRIIAIDLRLDTSGECKQSITITEGSTTTVFDCTNNNDYLPTVLFTSTSHFLQLQFDDNLGLAGGYYFILLEGTASGAELTLSCSTSAQSNPTIAEADLPECPVLSTTSRELSSDITSSRGFSSTESTVDVSTSTVEKSFTTSSYTVGLSVQTSLETITGSTIQGLTTLSYTGGSSISLSTEKTETSSSDSTMPTFVSLEPTSTEKDATGTLLSTVSSEGSSSTSDDTTGNNISTHLATVTTTKSLKDISQTTQPRLQTSELNTRYTHSGLQTSELNTKYTSSTVNTTEETNDPSDGESKTSNNIPLIAVIVVLLLVLAGIVTFFILYRDKLKEWCCKTKSTSKVEASEEKDENLLYASIFDTTNRPKPNQLPPMTHQFRAPTMTNKSWKEPFQLLTEENDVSKKKKRKKWKNELKQQDTSITLDQNSNNMYSENTNKEGSKIKRNKRKREKALKKIKKEEFQFKPVGNVHDKSTFPSILGAPLLNSGASRLFRRTSIIDIADSEGKFEKSVEINNTVEIPPLDSSSVV